MSKNLLAKFSLAIIILCCCILPEPARGEEMRFSNRRIKERVDYNFWKEQNLDSLEITRPEFPFNIPKLSFHSSASFRKTTFDSAAFFSVILDPLSPTLMKYVLKRGTKIRSATFLSAVDFSSATFESIAAFALVHFNGEAYFSDATFDSVVVFDIATFEQKANFSFATFGSDVGFHSATFNSLANFSYATFGSAADFQNAAFELSADFRYAVFGSTADFRNATFEQNLIFDQTVLPDFLDMRYVEISEEIDFTFARPPKSGKKCLISLKGTDINKIKLNMNLFQLWFPPDTLSDLIVFQSPDDTSSIYELVLKKLADDGFIDSHRRLDIEYKRLKYRRNVDFGKYFNFLDDKWWTYGYEPEWIYFWTLMFWLSFSFVNIALFPILNDHVYRVSMLDRKRLKEYFQKNMRLFRINLERKSWGILWDLAGIPLFGFIYLLQVLTYTAVIFFGLKMDMEKFQKGVVMNHASLTIYLMVVYITGLICVGFIANNIFTR